ncbi:MAG: bifunctional 4-hydroxy-2-oxoglutarate aldolase/2-dehydro-3-deoxy-phosphogluconate aldolase [Kiritimatiellia bacterium]
MNFTTDMLNRFKKCGAAAGFTPTSAEKAVQLSKALIKGGIDIIELTLRTPTALEGLKRVCIEVPEMMVIAGTVLTPEQVMEVKKAGAHCAVAPGTNPRVVRAAQEAELPFAPGIVTPSELEAAIELGCRFVKFFPAGASGGIPYLRSMATPYKHLDIQYFPLGGVNLGNIVDYLKEENIPVAGGSWLTKKELTESENWDAITERAAELRRVLDESGVCG